MYVPVHPPEDAADEEAPPGELDERGDPGVGGTEVNGLDHLGGGGGVGRGGELDSAQLPTVFNFDMDMR